MNVTVTVELGEQTLAAIERLLDYLESAPAKPKRPRKVEAPKPEEPEPAKVEAKPAKAEDEPAKAEDKPTKAVKTEESKPESATMSITELRNVATQLSIMKDPIGAENREKIKSFLDKNKLSAMSQLASRPDLVAEMGELLISLRSRP